MAIRLYAYLFLTAMGAAMAGETAMQMLVENRLDSGKDITFFVFESGEFRASSSISGASVKNIIIEPISGRSIVETKHADLRLIVQLGGVAITKGNLAFAGSHLPGELVGALSPDGSKLCLSTINGNEATLWIVDMHSLKSSAIYQVKGFLSPAAWAPDGYALAFYSGGPEANTNDSFEVVVLTYKDSQWEPKPIAPRSLLCHRSPARTNPPTWVGGKGEYMLVEARYEESEKGPQDYIVSVADGKLSRVNGTFASYFPGHDRLVYVRSQNEVVSYNPSNGQTDVILSDREVFSPKLSPDAKFIAFCDKMGALVVREISTGKEWHVGDHYATTTSSNFSWIRTCLGMEKQYVPAQRNEPFHK